MYTEKQLEQAFFAGKEYAHAARNGQSTLGLRFREWKERLVKESDSLPCVSESDLSDSEFQLKRVYDWLMDDKRQPAQTKFTAGWQRNLAKEIEYRLSDHSR